MARRLLISAIPGETRAVILEDGRLAELMVARDADPELLGSLFLGRIAAIDKALGAAFVEIGLERQGLLPLSEAPGGLTEGRSLPVKVVREAEADKGVRLTARLQDPPAGLEDRAAKSRAPALLLAGDDPLARLLRPEAPPDSIEVEEPLAAGHPLLESLRARLPADLAERLTAWTAPEPLLGETGVEAEIEALLLPEVALPGGASLLVEPVRTLTAIDVNSGSFQARGGPEALNHAVNQAAVPEIARQIRLRQLSGLIVVDFLPLKSAEQRKAVAEDLRRAMAAEGEPHKVFPPAPSGLAEVTRRRGRRPLHEILTEPCGLGGSGRRLSPATQAFDALRTLIARSAGKATRSAAVRAPESVLQALRAAGPAAPARAALEGRLGFPLLLEARGAEHGTETDWS